jgi:hypothetical protein
MSDRDFESKRPDHPDFMDFYELKDTQFSGIRHNDLNGDTELWVCGRIRKRLSKEEMYYEPEVKLAAAFKEIFLIDRDVAIEDQRNVSPIIH